MTLSSCSAIFLSLISLFAFAIVGFLCFKQYKLSMSNESFKNYLKLAVLTTGCSILLLMSVNYITRDLHNGTNNFLGFKVQYTNCDSVISHKDTYTKARA